MKKTLMLLIGALVLAPIGTARSEAVIAQKYFYGEAGKGYTYEKLSPTKTGDKRDRYVTFTGPGKIDGETSGVFDTVFYLGPMKIKKSDLYAFVENKVYHTETISEFGGDRKYSARPIVMVVPTSGKVETWNYKDDDRVIKCKSKLVNSVDTKLKTFDDVVCVEKEYLMDKKKIIEKEYYANGYGLVRKEVLIGGKLEGMVSSELVNIE